MSERTDRRSLLSRFPLSRVCEVIECERLLRVERRVLEGRWTVGLSKMSFAGGGVEDRPQAKSAAHFSAWHLEFAKISCSRDMTYFCFPRPSTKLQRRTSYSVHGRWAEPCTILYMMKPLKNPNTTTFDSSASDLGLTLPVQPDKFLHELLI